MTPGRPPGHQPELLHDDGTVCHHDRYAGDPAVSGTIRTLDSGIGRLCANGQLLTGIAGLPPAGNPASQDLTAPEQNTLTSHLAQAHTLGATPAEADPHHCDAAHHLIAAPADLPKIKPFSWLGLESIGWAIIIGHLIKWAVSTWYYVTSQLGWGFMTKDGKWHSYWALTRPWDHAPAYLGRFLNLFGWHVPYLFLASTDHGWIEPRHLARGVVIGLVAGVFLGILFGKPKHPADVQVGPVRYALTLPMALLWAVPGIAVVAVLAWKLPCLTHHGLALPAGNPFASEVNGWVAAGSWIGAVMGLAGSQAFAKYATTKPADDAGWFFAERSAAKLTSTTGLDAHRHRIYGTPTHRIRVRYLLEHGTDPTVSRSPWVVRILLAAAFVALAMAGVGAWLTIAGPAAGV